MNILSSPSLSLSTPDDEGMQMKLLIWWKIHSFKSLLSRSFENLLETLILIKLEAS